MQGVPERHRRNRLLVLIPDQEGSARYVLVLHEAIGHEVSCARGGLGDGRVEVEEVLPVRVFEDLTAGQNVKKEVLHGCTLARLCLKSDPHVTIWRGQHKVMDTREPLRLLTRER